MGYLDQEKNSPEEYTVPQQCGAADRSTNRKLFNYEKLRDLQPLSLPFATFSVKSRFFMFFCALFTREQEEWTTKKVAKQIGENNCGGIGENKGENDGEQVP